MPESLNRALIYTNNVQKRAIFKVNYDVYIWYSNILSILPAVATGLQLDLGLDAAPIVEGGPVDGQLPEAWPHSEGKPHILVGIM